MLKTDAIEITPELLCLIAEIDEFKGAWRALGTLAPERLKALRRVATIESIGSSTRIEGSKLTDREVERLLANLEIKKFDTRDEQEVAGYAEATEMIFHAWRDIPITENHIKQLHRDLLRYSEKDVSLITSVVCIRDFYLHEHPHRHHPLAEHRPQRRTKKGPPNIHHPPETFHSSSSPRGMASRKGEIRWIASPAPALRLMKGQLRYSSSSALVTAT
jgi:hypothetical protein